MKKISILTSLICLFACTTNNDLLNKTPLKEQASNFISKNFASSESVLNNLTHYYESQGFRPIHKARMVDSINVLGSVIILEQDTFWYQNALFIAFNWEINPPIATTTDTILNGSLGFEVLIDTSENDPFFIAAVGSCWINEASCKNCDLKRSKWAEWCKCTQSFDGTFGGCLYKRKGHLSDQLILNFLP